MVFQVLVILALAPAAYAGPWPRPPGEHFISITAEAPTSAQSFSEIYGATYFERGLKGDWTLGLDAGTDGLGYQKTYLFLRRPVWTGRTARLAFELGAGQQTAANGLGYALRPALTWGRGVSVFDRSGWLTIDGSAAYLPKLQTTIYKSEVTFGVSLNARTKTMLQATVEQEKGRRARATVTPSAAYLIRPDMHLLGGVVLSGDQASKIKLGLWMTF